MKPNDKTLLPFIDDLVKTIADVQNGTVPARAFLLIASNDGRGGVSVVNQVFDLPTGERMAALLDPLVRAGFLTTRGH